MRRVRPTNATFEGVREARAIAATLGRQAKDARSRRRLTQGEIAARVGISRPRYAELERGDGAHAPLETWVRIGMAVGRPLAVGFSRDTAADGSSSMDAPVDAGHAAVQEFVLSLARTHRRRASVELPSGTGRTPHVADVVLTDDHQRVVFLIEIANRVSDLGALARGSDRKQEALVAASLFAAGDGPAYRVAVAWLLTDTVANRRLVARFPEFLRTRCPGSSALLARALTEGGPPPLEPALAWIDPRQRRLFPIRWRSPGRARATLPR